MGDIPYCPLLKKPVDWEYCHDLCNFHSRGVLQPGDTVSDWDEGIKVCKSCTRYFGAKSPYKSDFEDSSIISQACS